VADVRPVAIAPPANAAPSTPSPAPEPAAGAASPSQASPLPAGGPEPAGDRQGRGWPWLAFGAALLALLASAVAWHRLRRRAAEPADAAAEPLPDEPSHGPEAAEPGLALALEATRMSATLVNAALGYRLIVTNRSRSAMADVRVQGDMVAAHASRPPSELLGSTLDELPALHTVPALESGESIALTGELRLPLSAIRTIRSGDAALFVPLARLRAAGLAAGGEVVRGSGTFVVGQPAARARLHPFRLDLGPRLYSRVGQHLVGSSV
jgi:hypothetical protein